MISPESEVEWDTEGWDVVAEHGDDVRELLALSGCGDLLCSHSLEFVGNDDWKEQLSSPRPTHASTPSAACDATAIVHNGRSASSSTSASGCSTTSAAATHAAANTPLAGPGTIAIIKPPSAPAANL